MASATTSGFSAASEHLSTGGKNGFKFVARVADMVINAIEMAQEPGISPIRNTLTFPCLYQGYQLRGNP